LFTVTSGRPTGVYSWVYEVLVFLGPPSAKITPQSIDRVILSCWAEIRKIGVTVNLKMSPKPRLNCAPSTLSLSYPGKLAAFNYTSKCPEWDLPYIASDTDSAVGEVV
jgi:hypothetical protein